MSESFSVDEHTHRRYNPLTDEWLLVSPHRNKRPWQGQQETPQPTLNIPSYDPACFLCPGNTRSSGEVNPDYKTTFSFTNDFPALIPQAPESPINSDPLFRFNAEQGTSRVVCFSPDHSKTLPLLNDIEIMNLIKTWMQEASELGKTYTSVEIFENKGAAMGCSNPHPHGQIWAQAHLPTLVHKEDTQQRNYLQQHGRPLLVDYLHREVSAAQRIVSENDHWLVVVPFWAAWPFETLLLAKNQRTRITELHEDEQISLGNILRNLTSRYDNLFQSLSPYSMGWHGAPFHATATAHWQLHAHFYPPLLRSASVRKFMVGYEMLAEPQRDLSPEQAALRLRQQSAIHFTNSVNT